MARAVLQCTFLRLHFWHGPMTASKKGYANDVAFIVSKLLLRKKVSLDEVSGESD